MSRRTPTFLFALLFALAAIPATAAAQGREPDLTGAHIVLLREDAGPVDTATERREQRLGFRSRLRFRHAVRGFSARLTRAQVERLETDPEVVAITPERRLRATDEPLAGGETAPTGVRRIEAATELMAQGPSTANVAVLDTGIDLDAPELEVRPGPNCITPGASSDDDQSHGTHVSGTLAARNTGSGIVGVAPGTALTAVKVLDATGSATDAEVICGIDWVTATRTDGDPANGVDVVNMSLGGPGTRVKTCETTTDPMHKAICASTAAGVTYVVAAGNDGWDFDYPSVPDTPAAYPEVLTVSAMADKDGLPGGAATSTCAAGETDDRAATFSNFALTAAGADHTIAAPGVCIRSTIPGGALRSWNGTSMATPHVAAAVALCLREGAVPGPCAGLTPAQIVAKMRQDAAAYTAANPAYGFTGDLLRPLAGGRVYGPLVHVGTGAPPAAFELRPTAYRVVRGSVAAGTESAARLHEDDAERVELAAVPNATGRYLSEMRVEPTLSAAQRDGLQRLTVRFDGHVTTATVPLTFRIYNFAAGRWENLLGPLREVTADRAVTWSTGAGPSYLSSKGQLRVAVKGAGNVPFTLATDLVRFRGEG